MADQEVPKDGHTMVLENQEIKIFETYLKRGQKLPFHSHAPHIRYCYSAGSNLHTWKDGTQSVVVDAPGDWEVRQELDHAVENVGDHLIHSLIFEFKLPHIPASVIPLATAKEWKSALGSSGQAKKVADNESVLAVDIRVGPNQTVSKRIPPGVIYAFEKSPLLISSGSPVVAEARLESKTAMWIEGSDCVIRNPSNSVARFLLIQMRRTAPKIDSKL
jgi:hypothetical protein